MKKKLLITILIATIFISKTFAQTHWVSVEQKGPGVGLRYEFVITPAFTVGAFLSYSWLIIPLTDYVKDSFEAGITARWYPFSRRFFVDLSLGYNSFAYEYEYYQNWNYYYTWYYTDALCIAPGFGWTIDVGKMGNFFISPGVKFPITEYNHHGGNSYINITIAPYFGIGWAF